MPEKDPNRFYVYAYLREDFTPYYIGKGFGRRAYTKHGNHANRPADRSRIVFVQRHMLEQDALRLEASLIAFWGRKNNNTGILRNLTDGGQGTSGYTHSLRTREKLRNIKSKTSEETRKRMSIAQKNRTDTRFLGCRHTEESKRKMSQSAIGRKHTIETRKKISEGGIGRVMSEESKKKISDKNKGTIHTKETRRKVSEGAKRHWVKRKTEAGPGGFKQSPEHVKRRTLSIKIGNRKRKAITQIEEILKELSLVLAGDAAANV